MIFPIWAFYGLAASLLAALQPLVQERFKADAFALSYGIKVVMVLGTLPFVLVYGLPDEPVFYMAIAATAVIWCISDVYYYRAVQVVGAGPVSRLLPATAVLSFIAWLVVEPAMLQQYIDQPWIGAGITGCIMLATLFASCLTRCAVSRQAVRLLWFVMLASAMDPITAKLILHSAGTAVTSARQAPFAYVFIEALFMLIIWTGFVGVRTVIGRPLGLARRISPVINPVITPAVVKAAVLIGALNATRLVIQNHAYMAVDNPAYLRVLMFTDALWIIVIYKLVGRRETANVWAGLGIVASAAALVLLKSL